MAEAGERREAARITEGSRRLARIALLLAALAGATEALLWLTREPPPPQFVGPPRSDYELESFRLLSLGDDGRRAFTVTAPRLARHPTLGTLAIDRPAFVIADPAGDWTASAARGWVSADAKEVRLDGDVRADRAASATGAATSLRTESLTALTEQRRLQSPLAVTLAQGGSILSGIGFEADLAADRFAFAAEFRARHVPPPVR